MGPSAVRFVFVCVALACACWLAPAAAQAEEVTLGANVNQTSTPNSGTCGFEKAEERPCTIVTNSILEESRQLTSPCDGTVTRFRLNGTPRPANHYRLRVVHRNDDGSYTGTASSATVQIGTDGVNEYATNLPIAKGELLGIDFTDSTEEHGIRWVGGLGVNAAVLFDFPEDGTSAEASLNSVQFYYLFNGDITCAGSAGPPAPAPAPALSPIVPTPSNAFHIVSLKKSTLTVSLGSAGTVTASEVAKKKGGKKKAPLLLKPSSAGGGPGPVSLKLKLTGAAKAKLRRSGKVKVKPTLSFTPTGGTKSTQVRGFTVKAVR